MTLNTNTAYYELARELDELRMREEHELRDALQYLNDDTDDTEQEQETTEMTHTMTDSFVLYWMAHDKGGFTHSLTGEPPTTGYMVSNYGTEEVIVDYYFRPAHIQEFVEEYYDVLNEPDTYLGCWLDGKKYYLDISVNYTDKERAIEAGKLNKQLAIYDINNNSVINL